MCLDEEGTRVKEQVALISPLTNPYAGEDLNFPPPLGLLHVAAGLLKAGYNVEIVDT